MCFLFVELGHKDKCQKICKSTPFSLTLQTTGPKVSFITDILVHHEATGKKGSTEGPHIPTRHHGDKVALAERGSVICYICHYV